MDQSTATLLGVILGAGLTGLFALVNSIYNHKKERERWEHETRQEHERWEREQQAAREKWEREQQATQLQEKRKELVEIYNHALEHCWVLGHDMPPQDESECYRWVGMILATHYDPESTEYANLSHKYLYGGLERDDIVEHAAEDPRLRL